MKPENAVERFENLLTELRQLPADTDSPEFTSWRLRTSSVLSRALGENHNITTVFGSVDWYSMSSDRHWEIRAFEEGRQRAIGTLEAAIAELELLSEELPAADESGIDHELWAHVAPEVQAQDWGKVATGAVIFTEDRIRKWAGRPTGEVSAQLAVNVFGANGNYRMGLVEGEKQGWQLFAQGVAQALRNVDTHRIQNRPDHKRYAVGVLGACSLLLTQLRYEHGNRFHDLSPAGPEAAAQ
ncbi:TIGR02391 family protein [Mycobacterium colombiense]|uniref:TIGR02391 family protein n=1 Tax=Mycobacterium colombiense TaxID=339268 RepID=UPI0009E2908F|nr:TIGR02391 family protein [Mycobacterium colombiense]